MCRLYTSNTELRPTDLDYQSTRNQLIQTFIDNKISVLVATEGTVLGRQLYDIALLANFTLPTSVASYTERTALVSPNGSCFTLLTCLDSKAVFNQIRSVYSADI